MSNKSKAHIDRLIRTMHDAGSGAAVIADALKADGCKPSTRQGVYNALRRLGLADGAPPDEVMPTPAELEAGADPDSLSDWHELAAEGAVDARKRRDPIALARFVGLGTQIQIAQHKNAPAPATDPNAYPWVVEAAKRCREKTIDFWDRLVAEATAGKS